MKITITITCDNSAFDGAPEVEVYRILTSVAQRCLQNGVQDLDDLPLKDINGNTVGKVVVKGGAS